MDRAYSLVRHIAKKKLSEVKPLAGVNIKDVTSALANDDTLYRQVIVCVGTNYCASETMNVRAFVEHFTDLIEVVMEKVASPGDVVICSALPRTDVAQYQRLNGELTCALQDLKTNACILCYYISSININMVS